MKLSIKLQGSEKLKSLILNEKMEIEMKSEKIIVYYLIISYN